LSYRRREATLPVADFAHEHRRRGRRRGVASRRRRHVSRTPAEPARKWMSRDFCGCHRPPWEFNYA